MKKLTASILSAMLMLSMVFSSSVFAANDATQASALDSILGLFTKATTSETMGVEYNGWVQDVGQTPTDGTYITGPGRLGTPGLSRRLEGFQIKLTGAIPTGASIKYIVHVQDYGWMGNIDDTTTWKANGTYAGTKDESKRIEDIKIVLVGADGKTLPGYSVSYKGHVENEGDTAWVSDGASFNNTGKSQRLECLEVKVVQTKADMTAYNAAVAQAGTAKAADYTTASFAALTKALADNVVTDADTQAKVDAATTAINAAYAGLVKALHAVTVEGINANKLEVILSDAVDAATATNFAIPGMTVSSATLSEDKKVATLQVSDAVLGNDYNLTLSGLKIAGVTQPNTTTAFKMPTAVSMYGTSLTFADGKTQLTADGADQTLVTFKLTDKNGDVVTDADDVEVAFTTTFGNCAENRVTLQNGTASTLLISESLTADRSALVRATVIEAKEQGLINLTATASILMTPNPGAGQQETVGATLTDIGLEEAGSVVLYFNKDVTVAKYTDATTGLIDAKKAAIRVDKAVPNNGTTGTQVAVVGLKAVPGNTKALYAILGPNSDVLTDNANVAVNFVDKTGTVATNSTKVKTLTDARKPAMLTVARDGLKTITLTFSEPVITAGSTDSATDLNNWSIDGLKLNDAKYGVGSTKATATVGTFVPKTGSDTRNVVTITLGKDASGNQIYFQSGTHSVQGANIGDWANLTDKGNNVMNTQTLDFVIPEDNTVPNATVEVQSPEQYIVTFDKTIAQANPVFQLQKLVKGTWTTVAQPELKVTNLNSDGVTFKVETMKDWTEVYNTATTHLNFYNDNYRLVVAAGTVTSAANGKTNVEIDMSLNDEMLTPDVTSPVINTIAPVVDPVDSEAFIVTLSEPIKTPTGGDGLPTKAQGQTTIPQPTADFIKSDNSVTIPALAIDTIADASTDTQLIVTPKETLANGDWTLVVRSVSDDVGNTAASITKTFNVNKVIVDPQTTFALSWAVADLNYGDGFSTLSPTTTSGQDAVYLKFNKEVKVTGDQANALKTSNYTLNGAQLPTGTQIIANILNYNDGNSYVDSVTIILPDGTLSSADTTVITVSSYIENVPATGSAAEKLSNGGQFKLPYNFDTTLYNKLLDESAATTAVVTAETTKTQGDVTTALNLVNALPADVAPATLKADLKARLDAVQKLVDDAAFAASTANTPTAVDKAGADKNGMADVTWTALAKATSYTVYYTDGVTMHSTTVAASPAVITGLTAGTEYSVTVVANNGSVNSKVSAAGTVTAVDNVSTAAAKTADATAALNVSYTGAINIVLNGATVALTNTKVLDGTGGTPIANTGIIATELEKDIDAVFTGTSNAGNGNSTETFAVTVGTGADDGKLIITSTSTGVAATVSLMTSTPGNGATLLGFTTLTAVNGTSTN